MTSTGLVTAAYGTFLYQLDGSASGAPQTTARQWKYATLTDTWVSIKAIPSTRIGGAAGVATVGTKMYVLDGPSTYGNKKNEAYDTTTDTWATKASTPSDHAKAAVGVKNNKIYVAGGPETNKLEIYDAAVDSWTSGTALARVHPCRACAAAGRPVAMPFEAQFLPGRGELP
jgi:N-acetylneuraminic acid mutarotase